MHRRPRRRPHKSKDPWRGPGDRGRYDSNSAATETDRRSSTAPKSERPRAVRTICGMAAGRAGRGARVCAGVHAFSVCPESHSHLLFGIRQQNRTMNRELQRSADDRRLGGGMGLVAGKASYLMATRKRNVRWRRRRALGWTAKTGPIAGPSESPMATRTDRSTRGATSGVMASGSGLARGHRVS
jgi:hypothetical protein